MRLGALIQSLMAAVFGLGFLAFGFAAFIHEGDIQQRLEDKWQSIHSGAVQMEALIVVRKYVNPGRHGLPHIVFRSDRQPKVDIAVTRDLFNSVNLGDSVPGYYFPDGYFLPWNRLGDPGNGKWFFLILGLFVGGGVLALALSTARRKPPFA